MTISFASIQRKVRALIKKEPAYQLETGRRREEMVLEALRALKREGRINAFLRTASLSRSDLNEGVDFFIVYVAQSYKVCRLGVTGRNWVDLQKKKHPENQIIAIDLGETQETVEAKILRAIEAKKRNWS